MRLLLLVRAWPLVLLIFAAGFLAGQSFEHNVFCAPQPAAFQARGLR
jgi:hypothetical protein